MSVAQRLGFAQPDLYELTPNVSQTGAVTLTIKARAAGSVRYAVSTASEPTAATVRAAGVTALDSDGVHRSGTVATLTAGQSLYIAAFAYESGAGTGNESTLLPAKITHYEGGIGCTVVEKTNTDYTFTFRLQATDADGDTVKQHHRIVEVVSPIDDYVSGTIVSDAGFAAQPRGKEIIVDRGLADRYVEAWAEDVNGNKSPIVRARITALTTSAKEAAIGSFLVSSAFVGTCPSQDMVDTLTWSEAVGVPSTWPAKLYVCTTSGCTPPTSGPFNADAASGAQRTNLNNVQSGLGNTARRTYRIRLENSYGELVDDDVSAEEVTVYDPC